MLRGDASQRAEDSFMTNFRRVFLSSVLGAAIAPITAFGKRRRKRKAKPKRKGSPLLAYEKRQLIEAMPSDTLRLALALRLLSNWSDAEIEAELQRREEAK